MSNLTKFTQLDKHLIREIQEIAAMKYEGSVSIGNMIIASKEHSNIRLTLELVNPISIDNYRTVRKFLELSENNTSIVSDSASIYGLGEIRGKYNPTTESLFVIKFLDHYKWELLHDNNSLMIVEYGIPVLPKDKIDRKKFYTDFPRILKGITKEQINALWDIVSEATNQKHGTMLVISDEAENEAARLSGQCFAVKPFNLTNEMVLQVTAIDGAVLIDRNCTCYAIGVIWDGLATLKGNIARGARYNSALRYYEYYKNSSVIIVVISEDGMIDLIPNLMPQIKHSDISKGIDELSKIFDSPKFDRKKFFQLRNYFDSHEFYLGQEECDKINKLRKSIEEKFDEELGSVRFLYNDLKPNKEMNESYYVQENN